MLLTNCVQNVECQNLQVAIDTATNGINEMFDNLMSLLDVRAATFGLKNQVNKGLKDAYRMIDYSPTTPAGYLRCASLFILDNKYNAAMEICQQGMNALSFENDHNEEENGTMHEKYREAQKILEEKYNEAKTLENQGRVDFITRLPSDIICQILDYLPFSALLETLNVSKVWRNYVTVYPKIWSNMKLTTYPDEKTDMIGRVLSRQHHFSHHVQHLSADELSEDETYDLLIELIYGTYSKLESLDFWSSDMDDGYDECVGVLSRVKTTLKSLRFSLKAGNNPLPLGSILAECDNLKTFDYLQPCTVTEEALDGIPTTPINSLNDLTLACGSLPTPQLERILKCCPRVLILSCMNCDTSALEVVEKLCPYLYSFGLNASPYELSDDDKQSLLNNIDDPQTHSSLGIHHIYFDVRAAWLSVGDHDESLIRILKNNANVLETAKMRFGGFIEDDENQGARWENLRTVVTPHLRSLTLNFNLTMTSVISTFLSNCPALETLVFGPGIEFIPSGVFQAASRLSKLKELTVYLANELGDHGLSLLFKTFSNQEERNQYEGTNHFQKFKLEHCFSELSKETAHSLAKIPSLQEIYLDGAYMTQDTAESFAWTLAHQHGNRSSSSFHTMTLISMDCVTDPVLRYLNDIPSLRKVKLSHLRNITLEGLECLQSNTRISLDFTPHSFQKK
ncbi:hypothetical protein BDC45DRAFT_537895 [Circinella umbellata]|nr:hypothetical protein BDC45DRAFT_537895 [Circinella umbellata]